MAVGSGPFITKGITWGFDTGVPVFSNNTNTRYFLGRPTTNLSEEVTISTYNNVSGNVSSVLETQVDGLGRGLLFRGAEIVKQTLTPLDSTGVSYLTNGNNPGIGVVTGGGGGSANIYTGHSIFFKPTVPMHTSPIFTNYSNIGGWQSSNLYEDVGDGWYRAYVTWFNTTTQSDGKYWAINPRQAFVNQPIVIYWAGPFKESLNTSTVSPYVLTSRSNTNSLIDLSRNRTISLSTVSFDSNNKLTFDGTDDTIDTGIAMSSLSAISNFTFEVVMKINSYPTAASANAYNETTRAGVVLGATNYAGAAIYWAGNSSGTGMSVYGFIRGNDAYRNTNTYALSTGQYYHLTMVNNYTSSTLTLFVNGVQYSQVATATQEYNGSLISSAGNIGICKPQVDGGGTLNYSYLNCEIAIAKIYNYALKPDEVTRNYTSYKKRFGI